MIDPPLSPEIDLRDFGYMPLDVVRLYDSDLMALATGDEFRAAVALWCKAWHQVPAGSLPSDDRLLCHLAGFGRDMQAWHAVKAMALRGFDEATDGRLYHAVICEKALEAWEAKKERRERTRKATEKRKQSSESDRNDERDEQRNEHRYVHQGKGREEIVEVGLGNAREPLADLEAKLREAAGWLSEPAPNLCVTGSVQALIEAGAILEIDVLPTVRALAPQCRSRTGWKYFLKAIAQARDDRIAAGKIVSPPP